MNTATQLVAQAGKLLYGELWIAPIARDLGVNTRTMERLAAAARQGQEYQTADKYLREIADLLAKREGDLAALRAAIAAHLGG